VTETAIAACIAAIGSLLVAYLWGRKEQRTADAGKATRDALEAIQNAINKNTATEAENNETRNNIPDAWPDDGIIKLPEKVTRRSRTTKTRLRDGRG